MSDQITNHVELAKQRLLSQFQNKERIEGLLTPFITQIQDLEDAFYAMFRRLNPDEQSGFQLDQIGTIVGQKRLGFNDAEYRILLKARIARNTSNGDPESIASVFKLLSNSTYVRYQNLSNAQIAIGGDGDFIDGGLLDFIFDALRDTVAGGVRVNYLAEFDQVEPFSTQGLGAAKPSAGFGSTTDPLAGGKFARITTAGNPFGFDGESTGISGFGTIQDVHVGGKFVGI